MRLADAEFQVTHAPSIIRKGLNRNARSAAVNLSITATSAATRTIPSAIYQPHRHGNVFQSLLRRSGQEGLRAGAMMSGLPGTDFPSVDDQRQRRMHGILVTFHLRTFVA